MKKNYKKHYKLFVKTNGIYDYIRCDAKELYYKDVENRYNIRKERVYKKN